MAPVLEIVFIIRRGRVSLLWINPIRWFLSIRMVVLTWVTSMEMVIWT